MFPDVEDGVVWPPRLPFTFVTSQLIELVAYIMCVYQHGHLNKDNGSKK
jgi:hypothetical protein